MKSSRTLDARPGNVEHPQAEADASTRKRVVQSIMQHGPSTAGQLAARLGLTAAAVRRHLGELLASGQLSASEQRVYGSRSRGRPAKVFALTDIGRADFVQAYDELAIAALDFLAEAAGPAAVAQFAQTRVAQLRRRFADIVAAEPDIDRPVALSQALNTDGYVATVHPAHSGDQLCQHHCPVARVAERYPELCQAETEAFADLLGVHVQRLATLAHGDGLCTTHIPNRISTTQKGST